MKIVKRTLADSSQSLKPLKNPWKITTKKEKKCDLFFEKSPEGVCNSSHPKTQNMHLNLISEQLSKFALDSLIFIQSNERRKNIEISSIGSSNSNKHSPILLSSQKHFTLTMKHFQKLKHFRQFNKKNSNRSKAFELLQDFLFSCTIFSHSFLLLSDSKHKSNNQTTAVAFFHPPIHPFSNVCLTFFYLMRH